MTLFDINILSSFEGNRVLLAVPKHCLDKACVHKNTLFKNVYAVIILIAKMLRLTYLSQSSAVIVKLCIYN